MSLAEVRMWDQRVGAVSLAEGATTATFEFDERFVRQGLAVAPLTMPLQGHRIFQFPALNPETFRGLPGLLADSLPDRFGDALINAWLSRQDREPGSLDPVERLCYIGRRGMGALEFEPAQGPEAGPSEELDIEALSELASEALEKRTGWKHSLAEDKAEAMKQILRVGTSAGGARPKALIALDPVTGEVRSGQAEIPAGFEHWILKFDGVGGDELDLGRARGYGTVEFVYAQLATGAGIEMSDCQLLEEGDRRHFMTRRFDRGDQGERIHMQSLAAMAHLDFNLPGANAYEQVFQVIRKLGLGRTAIDQQFRRMLFNVVARNQDDHVKNIAFLMDPDGKWRLAPAFDVTYAYGGDKTKLHQMTINGKRDGFVVDDFRAVAELVSMKRGQAEKILDEVIGAVQRWPDLAAREGIDQDRIERLGAAHRLRFS
jgi:serine/threonine-protein kinase HipA